jgi:uncharacterized protein YjiS (DUF1127 family)
MSDRTFTHVSLLAPRRPPETAIRTFARSVVAEPYVQRSGAPTLPGTAPSPGLPQRADLWTTLRAAWRRQRTRRCLAELDAHMLKDIGISYAEAEAEANKPFWAP